MVACAGVPAADVIKEALDDLEEVALAENGLVDAPVGRVLASVGGVVGTRLDATSLA